MDDVASSQAHHHVCEGGVHGMIVVPEITWSLSIVVSIDLYIICFVRRNHKVSRDVFVEERVILLAAH